MTLRELRESKGVGPVEVARKMGVGYHAVYRLESTGTTLLTTLEAYAEAIGCDFVKVWQASQETRRQAQQTPCTPVN